MPDLIHDPRRPTYYLIGAAKCGTTTLAHHLRRHGKIFLTTPKEPNFFGDESQFANGFDWYLDRYYSEAAGFTARGEATPGYFHSGDLVAARIGRLHPEAAPRLILLLRHPVMRTWSHYRHRTRTSEETEGFGPAVRREGSVYVRDSMYARQLKFWIGEFGREAILILTLEDLARDPSTVLSQVWEHLEVAAPDASIENLRANVAAEAKSKWLMQAINSRGLHKRLMRAIFPKHLRRQMITRLRNANSREANADAGPPQEIVTELLHFFAEDLDQLEALTGQCFPAWRIAPEDPGNDRADVKAQVGVR